MVIYALATALEVGHLGIATHAIRSALEREWSLWASRAGLAESLLQGGPVTQGTFNSTLSFTQQLLISPAPSPSLGANAEVPPGTEKCPWEGGRQLRASGLKGPL